MKRGTKWVHCGGDAVGVQDSAIDAHVIVRIRSPDGGTVLSEPEAHAFIAEILLSLNRNKRRLRKADGQ